MDQVVLVVASIDFRAGHFPPLARKVGIGSVVNSIALLPSQRFAHAVKRLRLIVRVVEQESFHMPVLGANTVNINGMKVVRMLDQLGLE